MNKKNWLILTPMILSLPIIFISCGYGESDYYVPAPVTPIYNDPIQEKRNSDLIYTKIKNNTNKETAFKNIEESAEIISSIFYNDLNFANELQSNETNETKKFYFNEILDALNKSAQNFRSDFRLGDLFHFRYSDKYLAKLKELFNKWTLNLDEIIDIYIKNWGKINPNISKSDFQKYDSVKNWIDTDLSNTENRDKLNLAKMEKTIFPIFNYKRDDEKYEFNKHYLNKIQNNKNISLESYLKFITENHLLLVRSQLQKIVAAAIVEGDMFFSPILEIFNGEIDLFNKRVGNELIPSSFLNIIKKLETQNVNLKTQISDILNKVNSNNVEIDWEYKSKISEINSILSDWNLNYEGWTRNYINGEKQGLEIGDFLPDLKNKKLSMKDIEKEGIIRLTNILKLQLENMGNKKIENVNKFTTFYETVPLITKIVTGLNITIKYAKNSLETVESKIKSFTKILTNKIQESSETHRKNLYKNILDDLNNFSKSFSEFLDIYKNLTNNKSNISIENLTKNILDFSSIAELSLLKSQKDNNTMQDIDLSNII